jgi:Rad3-related DNA helicase
VNEARSEWLKSIGRDPFTDLVVPSTGIKLLQWTGRAIRTENDHATVICYGRRLIRLAFGRRMLAGLPPYAVSRRLGGLISLLKHPRLCCFALSSQNIFKCSGTSVCTACGFASRHK